MEFWQRRDALVGQTIVFTARLTATSGRVLAAPPYTYGWSSLGPQPLLTGRETTNVAQGSIQHVFAAPGFASIDVENRSYECGHTERAYFRNARTE